LHGGLLVSKRTAESPLGQLINSTIGRAQHVASRWLDWASRSGRDDVDPDPPPSTEIPEREALGWRDMRVRESLVNRIDDAKHGRVRSQDDFLDKDREA
jgi:hypothetical protein